MNTIAAVPSTVRPWQAILAGGLVAGSFDLISAYISYGWNVPRGIAAGLLGPEARHGGLGAYILGIFLHYFIALSAAAVFYLGTRKLGFLTQHPLVCGLFFGIAVFLVMTLVVVPLSALHFHGPFSYRGLVQGLLIHMFLIGVPIAYCARQFSK